MANMGSIEERVLAFNNEEDAKFIFNKSFDELSLNEQIILRRYQNDQMNPVWKNIILDSEEKYSVDRCGNVKRISDGKFLKVYSNTNGYASVYIPELKNIKHVHRIIAEAFIPNPENKPQVNHINGNKLCNWVGNLEWVTAKENAAHAWETGLTNNSGENQGSSKYTNKQIELVCTLLESGKSYKYISEKNEDLSRAMFQKLIKENKILVNGKIAKESYKIVENDEILIEIEPPKDAKILAEDIPLEIIYEDNDILIVNKPKGMVVHPGAGNHEGTLVNAILAHCKESLSGIGGVIRPGIVHRIDKDTSGLLIIAKNDHSHLNLSEQIKNREVQKVYIALIKGFIEENEATIDMPIARSDRDRKKMAIVRSGKNAITHFKVLKRIQTEKGNYTLIEAKIETGRTHQIRVHMSYIKHPVVGDEVYSNGKNEFGIKGQALHALKLEFKHPTTGKTVNYEAPYPEWYNKIKEI